MISKSSATFDASSSVYEKKTVNNVHSRLATMLSWMIGFIYIFVIFLSFLIAWFYMPITVNTVINELKPCLIHYKPFNNAILTELDADNEETFQVVESILEQSEIAEKCISNKMTLLFKQGRFFGLNIGGGAFTTKSATTKNKYTIRSTYTDAILQSIWRKAIDAYQNNVNSTLDDYWMRWINMSLAFIRNPQHLASLWSNNFLSLRSSSITDNSHNGPNLLQHQILDLFFQNPWRQQGPLPLTIDHTEEDRSLINALTINLNNLIPPILNSAENDIEKVTHLLYWARFTAWLDSLENVEMPGAIQGGISIKRAILSNSFQVKINDGIDQGGPMRYFLTHIFNHLRENTLNHQNENQKLNGIGHPRLLYPLGVDISVVNDKVLSNWDGPWTLAWMLDPKVAYLIGVLFAKLIKDQSMTLPYRIDPALLKLVCTSYTPKKVDIEEYYLKVYSSFVDGVLPKMYVGMVYKTEKEYEKYKNSFSHPRIDDDTDNEESNGELTCTTLTRLCNALEYPDDWEMEESSIRYHPSFAELEEYAKKLKKAGLRKFIEAVKEFRAGLGTIVRFKDLIFYRRNASLFWWNDQNDEKEQEGENDENDHAIAQLINKPMIKLTTKQILSQIEFNTNDSYGDELIPSFIIGKGESRRIILGRILGALNQDQLSYLLMIWSGTANLRKEIKLHIEEALMNRAKLTCNFEADHIGSPDNLINMENIRSKVMDAEKGRTLYSRIIQSMTSNNKEAKSLPREITVKMPKVVTCAENILMQMDGAIEMFASIYGILMLPEDEFKG